MAKEVFNVKISPEEVRDIIEKNNNIQIIDVDKNDLDENKQILIVSCMKYYMRISGHIPLIIVCESMNEYTQVKLISVGGESEDAFYSSAGKHFVKMMKKALENYII